ncbi:hypothetical protein [Bradyrhizobium sp.]|uniref:hypothetical protein n=1 Tax=Bradyrhizobium sp. TaxID=376 RepID=UPI003C419341
MIIRHSRSLPLALLIAALPLGFVPTGFALAAGSGGSGAIGAGMGAAGIGSAAVGGGAASVGGGPPAGAVGGGSPGSNNPAGNGAAGTGSPRRNAVGLPENRPNVAPGIPSATTTSGYIGGTGISAPPPSVGGGVAPSASTGQPASDQRANVPKALEGMADRQVQISTTGLAVPGPDGVSTVTVPARPCGLAAHSTDGASTCVGIPGRIRRGGASTTGMSRQE